MKPRTAISVMKSEREKKISQLDNEIQIGIDSLDDPATKRLSSFAEIEEDIAECMQTAVSNLKKRGIELKL